MKEETKRMIRDTLVSLLQLQLGRAIDLLCGENRYGPDSVPYMAVGLKDDGIHLRLLTEESHTDKNPWHDSVYYLGTLDMSQFTQADYDCECDVFQEKIEKYIDDKLNEPNE